MNDDHTEIGQWAAAYLLGALDADDRGRFEQHRRGCEACRSELAALAPVPSLLSRLGRSEVAATGTAPVDPTPADQTAAVGAAAAAEYRRLAASRQRWRRTATATAAACLVLVGVGVANLLSPAETSRPVAAAAILTSEVATARITTSARAWGTEVGLELTGLPARPGYQLWAIDTAGSRVQVAAWGPTPSGGTRLTGATAIPTVEVDRLLVTSDNSDEVLVDAVVNQET